MIIVVHPDAELWDALRSDGGLDISEIRDGGFTEIPAGTLTAIGWIEAGR